MCIRDSSPNALAGNEISRCDTSAAKYQSETAGLGANCEIDEFKARFKGIKAPESTSEEMYNKNETTDTQVQALSGATVTSRAITRAVKGILFYDASGKEAGQYE